ncbi:MAG: DNA mismatch repair endonuclease MutL [Bacteroidota bacterium]
MTFNKIKLLPDNVANKIAAGEVVQRPESVVKELLENSVDAGAENISVIVKHAGKTLIQIIDDGEGMTEEDALLSLQRHATSKISSFEDLGGLRTYGFRGEALSSIASVSQFEIRTQRLDEELGTSVILDDSGQLITGRGAFGRGTTIFVRNLFFNTPARRNFMKSDATELKHIIETFKKTALSQPEIYFKFYNDDDLIFDYKPGSVQQRIEAVFADNIYDALLEVKEITEFMSVTGVISKPSFLKKSRGEQYLFVNKRFVNSKMVNHSVFSAYENMIDRGDFPFFVLFISLDPARIDINVHPSKLEVKFEDEKDIYSFMHAVIKKTLHSYDLIPHMSFEENTSDSPQLNQNEFRRIDRNDFTDRPNIGGFGAPAHGSQGTDYRRENFPEKNLEMLFGGLNREIRRTAPESEVDHPFSQSENREIYHSVSFTAQEGEAKNETSFIVQLHNKYILSQIKSGLMIIDQHVAHERILYEKALKSFNANMPFSQQLLFSQTMTVDPSDFALLKELYPFLVKLGFELKFFGKNSVVIDGVPQDVKVGTEEKILLEILDEYKRNDREKHLEQRDNLAKSFSCKSAIKAGDKLTEKEMRLLVDQLFATTTPYVCPHGRPVIIKIPLEEFDKRFGRLG